MRNIAITKAKKLCDTIMGQIPAADFLPPEHRFFYHQGVFLSGMLNIYSLCGDEKYFAYAKSWVDSIIDANGNINSTEPQDWLDDIQAGILLYVLYEKTADERYKKALDYLIGILKNWKKNQKGGFWHSMMHKNQMWLDSLYMGSPILAEYAARFNAPELFDEVANQAILMHENMTDKTTGLMRHAWDETKTEPWADKETGLSSECWGRAQGWYAYAMLNILSFLPNNHPKRARLIEIEKTLLKNIMCFRDEKTKLWHQIVDKGEKEGNWIENSCSFLFTASIAKAVHMGILEKEYISFANESFNGALKNIDENGENIFINHVCIGTCVCDYEGYISRPTSVNDLHGCGAFLLMCYEIAKCN